MDFKKIADHFRNDAGPLSVGQIVIVTESGDFTGSGKLRLQDDRIELDVTLTGGQELPMIGGTIMRDRFWKIGGVIEDQVPFWANGLPHQHSLTTFRFLVRGGRLEFDRLHLLAIPFDQTGLREAVIHAANSNDLAIMGTHLDARLTNYKLVWREEMTVTVETNPFLGDSTHTERNTLKGMVGKFEYALIQRKADCDLHIRLKKGAGVEAGEIGSFAQAFYRALAFVHGRHTWPQWELIDGGDDGRAEYMTAPIPVIVAEIMSANMIGPDRLASEVTELCLP